MLNEQVHLNHIYQLLTTAKYYCNMPTNNRIAGIKMII